MTAKRTQHNVDLSKGSLPIVIALALLAMVGASAYGIGNFVSSLKSENDRSTEKFTKIDGDLTAIRSLIESGNFVRRGEFELWCRNTEALNKNFKCGNIK